jgi:hypothetical protein
VDVAVGGGTVAVGGSAVAVAGSTVTVRSSSVDADTGLPWDMGIMVAVGDAVGLSAGGGSVGLSVAVETTVGGGDAVGVASSVAVRAGAG